MSGFNAQGARAKRPCPLWVDAFQRDTQHLATDEVGSYMLILMAMWTRESCDFPNDAVRLARVSRVSARLWKSRIGPVILEFFDVENGVVTSPRLRREASYVERQVSQQSVRKAGEKAGKTLKNNKPPQSTDGSVDHPWNHPSQQPNNPTFDDDDDERAKSLATEADPTTRERLLLAMGADPISGIVGPNGCMAGTSGDMVRVNQWKSDLGLSVDEQVSVIAEVMSRKRDGPPSSLKYFTKAMQDFAGEKNASALTPTAHNLKSTPGGQNEPSSNTARLQRIITAAAEGTSRQDWG